MKTPKNPIAADRETPPAGPRDAALIASEARYRRLFETSQDGILIIDADTGRIIDVNPFLVQLLGYRSEEFVGQALWRLGPFKDIRANKAAFRELLREGYIRYEHLPLETKDGRCIEVEFISNVYQVGHQRTIQCNIRDNSQRKQVEKENRVVEAKIKQAQKMSAIAILAGGVAHQFNNALAVIIGSINLLEEETLDPELEESMELIKKASFQMSRMTRELLAFARGEKYNIETLSLEALISNSLPLIKNLVKSFITIEIEIAHDLPPVRADRDQMQMALLAIVSNASEAIASAGRIRIVCRKEVMSAARVKDFPDLMPGCYVSLMVEDNGRGMDEETCRRVFEPFFTTHFPGKGLVMAAIYGMVKSHKGYISIESQVGQGTTVCLYLPAYETMEETIQLSQPPERKAGQGSAR